MGEIWGRNGRETAVAEWRWTQTLRIDINGTWRMFGVNPDLMCQCKGIANGQPLAAVIGNDRLRGAVSKITATGSFWSNAGAHQRII